MPPVPPSQSPSGQEPKAVPLYAGSAHRPEDPATLTDWQTELKKTQSLAGIGSWVFDLQNGRVSASEEAYRIYGLPLGEFTIKQIQTIPLPAYRPFLDAAMRQLIEKGTPYDVEFEIQRPCDGAIRFIHSIAEYDAERRLVTGVFQDITERKATEARIRERETYLKSILQTSVDGFWVVDTRGRILEVNEAYCRMSGYSREELLQSSVGHLDAVENPPETVARMERIRIIGSEIFETRHRRKDGSIWPVEVSTTFLNERGGQFVCFCRDLTERKKQDRHIRLLGEILDAAPVAVMILSPDGSILFANRITAGMHGYATKREFMAVHIRNLDTPEEAGKIHERLRLIEEEGLLRFETAHVRKDGTAFPLDVTAKKIEWEGHPAILSISSDISERKKAEAAKAAMMAELNEKKEAAEQANRARDEFLAVMSHEMRTPLNAILGFANLLLMDGASGETRDYLETIVDAGERQLTLIDNILSFAQLDRSSKPPTVSRFRLLPLCEGALRDITPRSDGLHLSLENGMPGLAAIPDHLEVATDQSMLVRILGNLLGNAAKYTEKGYIKFWIGMEASDAPRRRFTFCVEDSGIGISPEHQSKLFLPFSQVDSSYKRQFEGAGLGLAICQKLCDLLGGEIRVDSDPGKGSRFTVSLELEVVASDCGRGDKAVASPSLPVLPSHLQVLVVDDSFDNAMVAQAYLARFGASSTVVSTGEEAISLCEKESFDVILMDLAMPGMDGLQATREIRRRPGPNRETPVIALTADVAESAREACRKVGMLAHLTKPIRGEYFFNVLKAFCK